MQESSTIGCRVVKSSQDFFEQLLKIRAQSFRDRLPALRRLFRIGKYLPRLPCPSSLSAGKPMQDLRKSGGRPPMRNLSCKTAAFFPHPGSFQLRFPHRCIDPVPQISRESRAVLDLCANAGAGLKQLSQAGFHRAGSPSSSEAARTRIQSGHGDRKEYLEKNRDSPKGMQQNQGHPFPDFSSLGRAEKECQGCVLLRFRSEISSCCNHRRRHDHRFDARRTGENPAKRRRTGGERMGGGARRQISLRTL